MRIQNSRLYLDIQDSLIVQNNELVKAEKHVVIYYTENYTLNQEMNKFLFERDCSISNWRSEGQWPMRTDDAMKFVRSFKELVVINEKEEIELYSGPPTHLEDVKMKQLLLNPTTNKLRNPILFLKQESIVIVGWSRSMWSDII